MVEGNFRVTTAAVNELYGRATAAAIRKTIVSCLVKLGIFDSLTADNGSNVLKIGEMMRSDFALTVSRGTIVYLNLHITTQLCRDYVFSFESRASNHLKHCSSFTSGSAKYLFSVQVQRCTKLWFRFGSGKPMSNFKGAVSVRAQEQKKFTAGLFRLIFVFILCFNGIYFGCILFFGILYEQNFAMNLVVRQNKKKSNSIEV